MKNKMKNRVIEMKDLCLLWLFLFLLGGIPAGATTISDDELASGTEELIAFPGAEGFGRNTTGGRGGKVYHVIGRWNASRNVTLCACSNRCTYGGF